MLSITSLARPAAASGLAAGLLELGAFSTPAMVAASIKFNSEAGF